MRRARLLVASLLLLAPPRRPAAGDMVIEALPGASRAIDLSLSASRDNFAVAYQLTPIPVVTAGADVGLVGLRARRLELRLGFVGLVELQGEHTASVGDRTLILPTGVAGLWRGRLGFSLAASSPRAGRLVGASLGELTLSLEHESAHFTGSRDGNPGRYPEVVIVGDYVRLDAAARWLPAARWRLDAHLQGTLFVPSDGYRAYDGGAGADLIASYALDPRLRPFASLHADFMLGADGVDIEGIGRSDVPDWRTIRQLLGVSLPGPRGGSIELFASLEAGNGHGLLAYQERLLLGGGIRFCLLH